MYLYLVLISTALRLLHNAFAAQKLASCLGQAGSISMESLEQEPEANTLPSSQTLPSTEQMKCIRNANQLFGRHLHTLG